MIIPSGNIISATTIRAAITPINIVKLEPDDPGTTTKTISHNPQSL